MSPLSQGLFLLGMMMFVHGLYLAGPVALEVGLGFLLLVFAGPIPDRRHSEDEDVRL